MQFFCRINFLNFTSIYILLSDGEIDYVRVINRALPNDIRVLGWCTVPVCFSARYVSLCEGCVMCNFLMWS